MSVFVSPQQLQQPPNLFPCFSQCTIHHTCSYSFSSAKLKSSSQRGYQILSSFPLLRKLQDCHWVRVTSQGHYHGYKALLVPPPAPLPQSLLSSLPYQQASVTSAFCLRHQFSSLLSISRPYTCSPDFFLKYFAFWSFGSTPVATSSERLFRLPI